MWRLACDCGDDEVLLLFAFVVFLFVVVKLSEAEHERIGVYGD